MGRLYTRLASVLYGRKGTTLIEYGFILVLMVIICVIILKAMGVTLNNTYSVVNSSYPQ